MVVWVCAPASKVTRVEVVADREEIRDLSKTVTEKGLKWQKTGSGEEAVMVEVGEGGGGG